MDSLLQDLCGHQAWADAQLWRAIEAHPAAHGDKALRERLHHTHLVQRSFMWVIGDRSVAFAFSKPEHFETLQDLQRFAAGSHHVIRDTLATMTDARLAERISIPWFKDPPLTITIAEALTQCAMHSQWHRAQNATRLRELGAPPPAVDLIVWYWLGRPSHAWD